MFFLQGMYLFGNVVRCIIGREGGGCLEDNLSIVALLADLVNGNACDSIAGCFYGLVYVPAIHALATIFRQ